MQQSIRTRVTFQNQAAFDGNLLVRVEKTFQGLLDLGYEEPIRRSQNLSALKLVAASVKK